ncbi:hypothetical protein Scep_027986 [Stephania cephalantha]|uniref:Uncharacterized protein n=1 Tax=Stephania cephalantha TaxID=152367 RepID=A0AAP0HJ30_9MAGN
MPRKTPNRQQIGEKPRTHSSPKFTIYIKLGDSTYLSVVQKGESEGTTVRERSLSGRAETERTPRGRESTLRDSRKESRRRETVRTVEVKKMVVRELADLRMNLKQLWKSNASYPGVDVTRLKRLQITVALLLDLLTGLSSLLVTIAGIISKLENIDVRHTKSCKKSLIYEGPCNFILKDKNKGALKVCRKQLVRNTESRQGHKVLASQRGPRKSLE